VRRNARLSDTGSAAAGEKQAAPYTSLYAPQGFFFGSPKVDSPARRAVMRRGILIFKTYRALYQSITECDTHDIKTLQNVSAHYV
jgi:hypothetical protein